MIWIIYAVVVLVVSGIVGLHLGRFREAYTEMTGMMAGMTMGMLNGFLLGYAAAALTSSMFWGNLVGIVLGGVIGGYFGRAGSLMGIMDGAMGGVMGGSMGAMLLVMLVWPVFMYWTAALLGVIYVLGMLGLVLLIEKSAPEHAAFHRLLPSLARWIAVEAEESSRRVSAGATSRAPIDDYYTFLGISPQATGEEISAAYLDQLALADEYTVARAERALSILTDPTRRRVYDVRLAESQARGDCCPPPRRKSAAAAPDKAVEAAPAPARAQQQARTAVAAQAPARSAQKTATATVQAHQGKQQKPQQRTQTQSKQVRTSQRPEKKEAPISWVGGVVVLTVATALLVWWLSNSGTAQLAPQRAWTDNGSELPAEFVKNLEAQAVPATLAANGSAQTLDFAVNGNALTYKPKVVKVKQGVPVSMNLSVLEGRDPGCGRYVGIEGLGVHGIATPGEVSKIEFTPSKTGIFQINCNMHMMDPGYIIVTQ